MIKDEEGVAGKGSIAKGTESASRYQKEGGAISGTGKVDVPSHKSKIDENAEAAQIPQV